MMEKRIQKRKKVRVLVKIDGKSGILSDYSEVGLQVSTNSPPANRRVNIEFSFEGQEVSLKGVIQWIKKRYSLQNAFQVGCSLENPPVEYFSFLKRH